MPLVKAKLLGFYRGSRVRPGETFMYSRTKLPKWVELVVATPEAEPEAEASVEAPAKKSGKKKAEDNDLTG